MKKNEFGRPSIRGGRVAISAATYRGAKCPTLKTAEPRGPKDQKNSRFRSRMKFSIENEIFERATHRGPIFRGEIETSRVKFSSEIKNSIEIENFDRDQAFLIVGPSGKNSRKNSRNTRKTVKAVGSRHPLRLFFGCFQCGAFGTSVGGRRDCKGRKLSPCRKRSPAKGVLQKNDEKVTEA